MINKKSENVFESSSPSPGRTIKNTIKEWADNLILVRNNLINNASEMALSNDIKAFYLSIFDRDLSSFEKQTVYYNFDEIASSAILSNWLMAVSTGSLLKDSSLFDALCWFLDSNQHEMKPEIKMWMLSVDISSIQDLEYDERFLDLYPYILEVFETNDEIFLKGSERLVKRKYGIYYTPSDVATFMVKNVAEKSECETALALWIDPACGSGIFLRSIMNYYLNERILPENDFNKFIDFFVTHIHGIDISKVAIQSTVFTILTYCLSLFKNPKITPWKEWKKIRGNLICFDSTEIVGLSNDHSKGNVTDLNDFINKESIRNVQMSPSIIEIFPKAEKGFTHFITNPPYVKNAQNNAIFLDFIRMMWRFCNSESRSCGIVVPLSTVFNSGKKFVRLRDSISKINGDWYFGNFDRTPDSLFGDDVKTRNTIIFHAVSETKNDSSSIFTTPLLRWNSRLRKEFLNKIQFTQINHLDISTLVPKIGSSLEMKIYEKFRDTCSHRTINQVISNNSYDVQYNLYAGKTSYNWLSIYPQNPNISLNDAQKHSTFNTISLANEDELFLLFGLVSSRLSYWLWRVECDGFHLPKKLIKKLQNYSHRLDSVEKNIISKNAALLWNEMRKKPIQSNNSGVTSISYCPYYAEEHLNVIDIVILKNLGFPQEYQVYFKEYIDELIIAGRYEERT